MQQETHNPELFLAGNTNTELNKWHHVAVVYEASKKKYTMYIDGSPSVLRRMLEV